MKTHGRPCLLPAARVAVAGATSWGGVADGDSAAPEDGAPEVADDDVPDVAPPVAGLNDPLDDPPPGEEHAFTQGEHGLYVSTDLGVDVICLAGDAAAARDGLGVEEVSEEAAECLRIESGRPRFSIDVGTETIPQEAGLNERAVSFSKGCYVGQETVARLHYKGKPNRHLRGLRLEEAVSHGDEIRLGDKIVGSVGSAAVSPAFGPIALALVRREAEPGAAVVVGPSSIGATVADVPFSE